VNLAAKLEKHNKVAGAVALTTSAAYREARAQGYVPPGNRRELEEANVAGVEKSIGLIILAE
jgi:adenylate cyclase